MFSKKKSLESIIQKKYQIIKKIENPLFYSFDWLFPADSNYERLIKNQIFFKNNINFFSILNKKINLLYFIIKNFIKYIFIYILKRKNKNKFFKKKNIFFSHLNNHKQLKNKKDFYFGNIPNWINEKYLIILNNNTKKNSFMYQSKLNKNQIIFPDLLSFGEEIQILFTYIRLINFFKGINISDKNFAKELKYQLYNKKIIYNLRKLLFIQKIFNSSKAERVFFTYEGHYIEAFIIKYAKKYKIKTIAYNHSFFYDFQKKYRNLHYDNFKPDIVLLTGRYIKKKIKFSHNQKILVVGSNRIIKNKSKIKNFNKKPFNCLILGDDVELTKKLFIKIYNFAKKNNKINFYFKLHPSIQLNQIIDNPKKFFGQSNIKFTEEKIERLFKKVKWAIYQRTTGVFNSIDYNVRPLYFDNLEISLDPLGEIKIWKKIFSNEKELQKILFRDIISSKVKKKINFFKVKKKLKNYFFAMNKNQVIKVTKL